MTRAEVMNLLQTLEDIYPNFEIKDPQRMLNSWHMLLEDENGAEIGVALKTFIKSSGSSFAPTISQLIAMTHKTEELSQDQAIEEWHKVRKAIGNGLYHAQEGFESLSELTKRVVGSPEQIAQWAQLESGTVIQSNFRRAYDAMQKREMEIKKMPTEIKAQIEGGKHELLSAR